MRGMDPAVLRPGVCRSVTPATQEAEAGRSEVVGQPGQQVRHSLEILKTKRGLGLWCLSGRTLTCLICIRCNHGLHPIPQRVSI